MNQKTFAHLFEEFNNLSSDRQLSAIYYLFGAFETLFDDHNEKSIPKQYLVMMIERAIRSCKND